MKTKARTKVRQEVRKIFCKYGRMIVRIDHVERHGCIEYGPTQNVSPPNCYVCKHGANLLLDGSLTDAQRKMVEESRQPASVPAFASGDL